ncbi:MAG: serine/threonine-protein kinase [Planctomycetota bacterium]|nr:serine/threonine-protein kinase [Planctomycetota bacterium]
MSAAETITMTRTPTRATAAGTEEGPPTPVEIPARLGSVSLVREIGKGGMGVVWLGRHEMLHQDVAVKFLLNAVCSDDDPHFAMFLEGARAAAALRHEGLNPVLNADVVAGVPFIVMEYVDGPTLAHVMEPQTPFPLAAARVVLEAACEAVAVLHEHGVVHRDIKPANILLAQNGAPVLTDFGLACARPVSSLKGARVEGVAGTPEYMAPEMFERAVSPRSDVYAMGVMMYELLTGHLPFEGDLGALREAHARAEMPLDPVRAIHPALADVIERACAKNTMFRTKSARHLRMALDGAFAQVDAMLANRARGEADLAAMVAKRHANKAAGIATPTPQAGATYYDRLSTIAQKRKSDVPQPEAAAGDGLADSVPEGTVCVRCGTAVGGLSMTARCPSCLLLVKYSTDPALYEELVRAAPRADTTPSSRAATPRNPEAERPPAPERDANSAEGGFLSRLWKRLGG